MRYKICLCISALCFFMAFLLLAQGRASKEEALAARISPQILRLHVLAASDRPRDQRLKLGVRDLTLGWVREQGPEGADKEELTAWISRRRGELEEAARQWLDGQGAAAAVHLTLARDHFPAKTYGSLTLPSGCYDAVRVTIGAGEGHNWWCVLYPTLCLSGKGNDEEGFKDLLTAEEYEALLPRRLKDEKTAADVRPAAQKQPRIEIRSRLWELLKR